MSPDEHLPQRYEGEQPALRRPRTPTRPGTQGPAASSDRQLVPPVHVARKLEFINGPGREQWWDLLDEAIKERIKQKVGERIEWWAYHHAVEKERPYAVVFGPRGLAVTAPTMNNAGRPAHMLRVRRFDPASVCYKIMQQQPSNGSAGRATNGPILDSGRRLPLTEDMRGFLGNLPADVQDRLQAPFLRDDPIQDGDYFYTGSDEQLNIWCYLAGASTVTFASGKRVAPPDAPLQAATWHVTCRMATVVPR